MSRRNSTRDNLILLPWWFSLILAGFVYWGAKYVLLGLPVVRELLGAMTAESAAQGIVIATSSFTSDAKNFARKHRIELVAGLELAQAIDRVKKNKNSS